jgi:hypothetical protein
MRNLLNALPLRLPVWAAAALACALAASGAAPLQASQAFNRYFPQIRPLLMGDAYVAVGDQASTVFYNPAGIANLPKTSDQIGLPIPLLDLGPIPYLAVADPEAISKKYQNVDKNDLRSLLGTRIYTDINLPLSFVALGERGIAFGTGIDLLTDTEVLGNPVLPGLHLELHVDELAFFTYAGRPTENLSLGITPKVINRVGIDKVFTFGELFASGNTINLDNNPSFKDVKNGKAYLSGGVDLGFIYRFPFWESWEPRFGAAMLNIEGYDSDKGQLKGIEFGKRPSAFEAPLGGEIPQLNSVGFAVSPTYAGIRYTVALDMVDVTRTVLTGNDWWKRTRLGMEVGIGIKNDGTALFSILGGYNATHPSFGFLSHVWIFEVGMGTYEVELGDKAGDRGEKRTVFEFSMLL